MSASATVGYTVGGYFLSGSTAAALSASMAVLPVVAFVAYTIYRSNRDGAEGEATLAALEADAARQIEALQRQRRAQADAMDATSDLRERARDLQGLARAVRIEAKRLESEHPGLAARLQALDLPESWADSTPDGLTSFVVGATPALKRATEELARVGAAAAALLARKSAQALGAPPIPIPTPDAPPPADPAAAALLARIEARCSLAEVAELAPWMTELAAEHGPARISALASELRAREQQLMDRRTRRERDRAEALGLIGKLPPIEGFDLEKLHHQLLLVAAGDAELTDRLRSAVRFAMDESALAIRAAAREVEAIKAKKILEGALQDLGYETEGISHTLFTEGGVAYFQGQAWGDYFVRLKVDPATQAANFGLVRATDEGEAARAVKQDLVMENEWCSESGRNRLFGVLRDRGMGLDVRKVFDIGALPVELVRKETVPGELRERSVMRKRAGAQASQADKPKAMQRPLKKS